ncbi:MAG: YqgE/AlgH family protein [Acidobacteriota bacterium]|nr:YqgE/AlgH family protein [Acidobacteriota bacterium]
MDSLPNDLEVPTLLMATPQVLDPFFQRSVVLLLGHTSEGSFGFNLNRPTTVSVAEILEGMEIPWGGDLEIAAYFGGPVQPQMGTILFEKASKTQLDDVEETSTEVRPGIWMTQHIDDLTLLAGTPPPGFRLYLGYAGWGGGQLIDEILRNDWILGPVIDELIFSADSEPVWELAMRAAGVDPTTLPSWTPDGDEEDTN